MIFKKCRDCRYHCRCCASSVFDRGPRCSSCENHYDEFYPSEQIKYCPLDGQRIKFPLYGVNGNIIKEEFN